MGSVNAPVTTTLDGDATISTTDAATTRLYDTDNTTSTKWRTNASYLAECKNLEFTRFLSYEPT